MPPPVDQGQARCLAGPCAEKKHRSSPHNQLLTLFAAENRGGFAGISCPLANAYQRRNAPKLCVAPQNGTILVH
jgi:hypothetical protein